ncbi:hypothetical protein ACVWW4_000079 [Bradyrhizobium sp. LB7.1]
MSSGIVHRSIGASGQQVLAPRSMLITADCASVGARKKSNSFRDFADLDEEIARLRRGETRNNLVNAYA